MSALEKMPEAHLVPVADGEIGGVVQPVVDGRELHQFLKVGRDYTTWIKQRIRKYDFVENQDFVIVQNLRSPDLVNTKARVQLVNEYHLTLEMAKELSMVENNAQGKMARRYFIKCEKALLHANNNLMLQFNRALLEFEKFSDLASQAGRTLNLIGKQLKPQSKGKLDALSQKLQPMLNFFDPEQ